MQRFSISQLSKLTGFDRRTVTNRLDGQDGEKQGRSITYTVRQLIDGITTRRTEQAEVLNLEQERARLAQEQRRKLERERAIDEAELLDAKSVLALWKSIQVQQRQKILNADLPEDVKADLIEDLREITLDEYQDGF